MDIVAIRVFSFSILPLIIAAGHLGLDRTSRSRERKLEIFLLYLFGLGVAGSGIGGFFAHFFISDSVAESIGWPTGNPFQLEGWHCQPGDRHPWHCRHGAARWLP